MSSQLLNLRLLLLVTFFIAPFCAGYAIDLGHNSEASYTNESDSDLNEFSKKWFRIDPGSGNNGIWENKEVKYYLDGVSSKSLESQINEAMNLWYCSGLSRSMKVTRVHTLTSPKKPSDRSKYIVVKKASSGGSSSTNGCPAGGSPVSTLSVDPGTGMQDVLSNIAHEIGHWFGLLHEHQNPEFWGYLGAKPAFEFRCRNLKDYDDKTRGKSQSAIDELCNTYSVAGNAGFSAMEFAPIRTNAEGPDGGKGGDVSVDWDSIMLYPSKAGGRGSGNDRANVLMRLDENGNNPQEIPANLQPSAQDVEALHQLYGIQSD